MSASPKPVLVPAPVPGTPAPPAPSPAPRGGRPWGWLLLAVVLAGGVWYAYRHARSDDAAPSSFATVRTATAIKAPLDRALRLSGQTSARTAYNIAAPRLMGPESNRPMVLQSIAASGARVRKGAIVAEIDAQSLKDHVDDVHDQVEAADADVRKRQAEQAVEWEQLQQNLRIAKADAEKARLEAAAAEVRTVVDRELLKLSADEADAAYKQLQADVAHKKAAQEAELKILVLTRQRQERHRDRHKNDVQKFLMRAPIDGMVVLKPIFRNGEMSQTAPGDQVAPGMTFMTVVNPDSMHLEAAINQSETPQLRIGQKAELRFDAFPGLALTGKVHSIGALATKGWRDQYYIRTVPVRVSIEGHDPRVIPDLSASADVVLDQRAEAVQVPLAALQREGNENVVYVQRGVGYERRVVQVSSRNTLMAAVSSVQPGEVVLLDRPATLQAGL